uniref:Xylanolytic transcriptional activator regulatory domain-containing protein n=1 Tax=Kwoniella bestiolae CBS 10118 TaxID=1296100 RepID=A0A1B9FX74_9TREE|nr:hypothetical protein I302_06348 [Kwoniella bestiolae CBS 10118]OCF23367.1 hypothetical protein I302_06348 [Kwoniella bestiolae CBS 10118]
MSHENTSLVSDNSGGDADSQVNVVTADTGSIVSSITRVSRALNVRRGRRKENVCFVRKLALAGSDPPRRASKRPLSPASSVTIVAPSTAAVTAPQPIPSPISQSSANLRPDQPVNGHPFSVSFDPLIPAGIAGVTTSGKNISTTQLSFGSSPVPGIPSTMPTAENAKPSASNAVRTVEEILEHLAAERFGLAVSLAIPSEHIFSVRSAPRMTLQQIGLAPGTPTSLLRAREWIGSHFGAIHHNTPFLHLPQINDIASRFFSSPAPIGDQGQVGNDEAALLLSVLALGSFRRETWDDQRQSYRNLHPSTPSSTTTASGLAGGQDPSVNLTGDLSQFGMIPLTLFRLAQDELDEVEHPSEAAVQALFLLHTFVSNTSMGRRSRDFVARAIMMAHEIGLNRTISMDLDVFQTGARQKHPRSDYAVARRRAVLYLYVYFSDVPPLIKQHDYSPDLFDPILNPASMSGFETPSSSATTLGAFVDLVRTSGQMLELLHGNKHRHMRQSPEKGSGETDKGDAASAELILQLDAKLFGLRERLSTGTFDISLDREVNVEPSARGATAGKLLRQIHYNWLRIAMRAPFLGHPLLGHSSLAICATSALSLLHYHRYLRRITTAIHIVFIAYWKGEIPYTSACTAINNALTLLTIMSARWQSATSIAMLTIDLAKRSDLPVQQPAYPINQLANETLGIPPPAPLATANPEMDFGTLFQLASNYIDQDRYEQGDSDPSQEPTLDGTLLPVWGSSSAVGDAIEPDTSMDFWADLIGPLG